ncbi:expressed unknown protein [Seminavis robusta]|uniref:Uncharacterized protein n=1 Tax=Seminavis robusta TaxID=568900 RepID=A0A9N8EPF0_9STRA|nr:expressed unknown protein [Seminavis robusta]|eukprot:Sro1596_g284750.1 n/a (579) ;mRNA; r:4249-5985
MKIVRLAVIVATSIPAVSGGSFRAAAANLLESLQVADSATASARKPAIMDSVGDDKPGEIGAMIYIHGAVDVPSEKHEPVVSKCFVDSYGEKLGYSMKSFKPNKEIDVKDNEPEFSLGATAGKTKPLEYLVFGNVDFSGCALCPPDDDAMLSSVDPLSFLKTQMTHPSATKMHKQFETDFCGCLADSGMKTYKHAHGCKIKYLFDYSNGDSPVLEDSSESTAVASVASTKDSVGDDKPGEMGALIFIHGAVDVPSEKHAPIVSKCFVDSYGEKMGYSMESFKPHKEIDVKDDEHEFSLHAAAGTKPLEYLVWGNVDFSGCALCPPDDDAMLSSADPFDFIKTQMTHPSAPKMHKQFETDFCDCLVESGMKTYKHAHGCKIEYVFDYSNGDSPVLEDSSESTAVASIPPAKDSVGDKPGEMGAMIFIHGAVDVPSEKHAPIVSKCFVDSYGEKMGVSMKSFKPNKEIDVKDDEHEFSLRANAAGTKPLEYLVWGNVDFSGCALCPPDDDAMLSSVDPLSFLEAQMTHPSAPKMHKQFETDFCGCLIASGMKTYKYAHGCEIKYVFDYSTGGEGPVEVSL